MGPKFWSWATSSRCAAASTAPYPEYPRVRRSARTPSLPVSFTVVLVRVSGRAALEAVCRGHGAEAPSEASDSMGLAL